MATAPIVEKIANPQGGMVDPNTIKSTYASIASDHANKPPSASATTHSVNDAAASGLVEQLAGMELRDGGKPINHLKIPAHQHDERKLFVGGLPTNGRFNLRSSWGRLCAVL